MMLLAAHDDWTDYRSEREHQTHRAKSTPGYRPLDPRRLKAEWRERYFALHGGEWKMDHDISEFR
ncbi:hypothetical protein [Pseudolysinimonas sp.]|uniref:hypothetical protein n=1 Tax=Pseudolysinimonas sp. TaxID=2680009 RepID=UPI003F7FFAE6